MPRSTALNIRVTRDGRHALDGEVALLRAELPGLAARIGAAREETPDPTENLGLRDALDALSQLESRIAERQALLAAAELIEEGSRADGLIRIGSRVTMRNAAGELTTYVLVSPLEASPRLGRISAACPVGVALLGAKSGQAVTANTPDGEERLVVVDVS